MSSGSTPPWWSDFTHVSSGWSEEKLEELRQNMPLGLFSEVKDACGVVAFLARDDCKFMTGGFRKLEGGCLSS